MAVALTLLAFEKDSRTTPPGSTPGSTLAPAPLPDNSRVNIEPRIRTPKTPQDTEERREPNIRVETQLVLINVTVTDPMNRFVTGLEKEHFQLLEDKVKQEITQFSSEDAPLSVGLVFDASGSMGSKLHKSRQAAAQLFKTANPEDEFFLIHFNDRPELVVGLRQIPKKFRTD